MKTVILKGIVTALSSIAHNGGEKSGLVTHFRRESFILPNAKSVDIPIISGNSARGAIRDLSAIDILTKANDEKIKVDDDTFDFLFSGGHLESTGKDNIDVAKVQGMRKKLPILAVLGGSVGNNIIPGKLRMGKMIPIAKETMHLLPDDLKIGDYEPQSVFTLTQIEMYVRKDDKKNELYKVFRTSQEAAKEVAESDSKKSQMMYFVETIKAGTKFYWQITLQDPTDEELGAFLLFLNSYVNEPFSLGGNGRVGHGDIKLDFYKTETTDSEIKFQNSDFVKYIDAAKAAKQDMTSFFEKGNMAKQLFE